jgi:hypothetical protein
MNTRPRKLTIRGACSARSRRQAGCFRRRTSRVSWSSPSITGSSAAEDTPTRPRADVVAEGELGAPALAVPDRLAELDVAGLDAAQGADGVDRARDCAVSSDPRGQLTGPCRCGRGLHPAEPSRRTPPRPPPSRHCAADTPSSLGIALGLGLSSDARGNRAGLAPHVAGSARRRAADPPDGVASGPARLLWQIVTGPPGRGVQSPGAHSVFHEGA